MLSAKNHKGFTLIELLLVIILLAISATIGARFYQLYSTDAKVKQTAVQMQEMLQAAANYYIDNGCWPNGKNCLSNVQNFANYTSFCTRNNPWGKPYSCNVEPTYGKKFQIYSGILPNSSDTTRLISLLPNSDHDPKNPNLQVLAEVVLSSYQFSAQYVPEVINFTWNLSNGDVYPFNLTCPTGSTPLIITSPTHILADDMNGWVPGGSHVLSTLDARDQSGDEPSPFSYCTAISSNGTQTNYQCNISANATTASDAPFYHPVRNLGNVTFMYAAFCQYPLPGNKQNIHLY